MLKYIRQFSSMCISQPEKKGFSSGIPSCMQAVIHECLGTTTWVCFILQESFLVDQNHRTAGEIRKFLGLSLELGQ